MNPGAADEALAPKSDARVRREPRDRWDELVLPEREKRVLLAALAELNARRTELLSAGSERALAHEPRLTLLFAGVRGTGKTLAAQLLADDLGVDVVTVDLVGICSLDRAQAEDQIGRAVQEAKQSRALLVFDRADALLGSGSSGRNPAFEFSEIVARGHRYPGVVVFTSWLTPRSAPSLPEGIDFVVEFPLPSNEARRQIWRRQLPPDARVDDDNVSFLAGSFFDAGATIRDCCVAAKAAAAADGIPVQMIHIGRALQREYAKHLVSPRADAALKRLLEVGDAGAASATGPFDEGVAAPEKPAPATVARTMPAPGAEPPKGASASTEAALTPREPAPASDTPPAPDGPTPPLGEADGELATAEPAIARTSDPQTVEGEPATAEPTVARATDNEALEPTTSEALVDRINAAIGRASSTRGNAPGSELGSGTATRPAVAAAPVGDQVADPERPSRSSPRPAVIALAGIVLAAALVAAIALLTSGGASPAALSKHASAGPVRISFPSDWHVRALPRARARGLSDALAVGPQARVHGLLVIGTRHAGSRNRLSRPLRLALSGRARAKVVTLGGLEFTVSRRTSTGPLYALPTTAGTVFGLCLTSRAAPGFIHDCEQILATVTLTAGRILRPGESVIYAAALNRATRELRTTSSKASSELRHAHSPQAQAAAATALAAAQDGAASAVSGLQAGARMRSANSSLVAALHATARAYGALAGEAAESDSSGYRIASGAVARANHSLQSALHRLRNLEYQPNR